MSANERRRRRLNVLAHLATKPSEPLHNARLCTVAAELTAVTGAGISLISDALPPTPICASDAVSTLIDDLQFTLGEGPGTDSYTGRHPVLEPDLETPAIRRWVAFTQSAVDAGVKSVFGFPLQSSNVCVGALNLYSDRPGALNH